MSSPKAILFIGATGGCGRSALQHSLDAGHTCIALARTPSKLTDVFSADKYPNLRVVEGNAHDKAAIVPLLLHPSSPDERLVDHIVFSIGGQFIMSQRTLDDPSVCQRGITTLLDALQQARIKLIPAAAAGKPRIAIVSSTGISKFGRDVPIAMLPLYHFLLKVPHEDKKKMEDMMCEKGGRGMEERWTIVRPSFLTDGATDKAVRVGIEDPVKGWEVKAPGYFISREDVGRWMFENIVEAEDREEKMVRKAVTIST